MSAVMMHPAWEAAYELLTDGWRWADREAGRPGGYYDWEIYIAMGVRWFAADVVVTAGPEGQACYAFPPLYIPIDEEEGIDVAPELLMSAALAAVSSSNGRIH